MTTVTFINHHGQQVKAMALPGQTLMQVALEHEITGILAECGGACSCGTCHVYVDSQWANQFPKPTESESFMLEIVWEPSALSRLGCQLKLGDQHEGLIVYLPKEQL
jgi:ferredoxin, 2Fe-2S